MRVRIDPSKINYGDKPTGDDGRGAAFTIAAVLTLTIVVASYFPETGIGQGGTLLLTVPFSPFIFIIIYWLVRRSFR